MRSPYCSLSKTVQNLFKRFPFMSNNFEDSLGRLDLSRVVSSLKVELPPVKRKKIRIASLGHFHKSPWQGDSSRAFQESRFTSPLIPNRIFILVALACLIRNATDFARFRAIDGHAKTYGEWKLLESTSTRSAEPYSSQFRQRLSFAARFFRVPCN